MTLKIRDYTPTLKAAIDEARAAGLIAEADELERAAFVVFTTSSEMFQEQGLAIRRFLKATRKRLPQPIKLKLQACLTETELACPGLGGLLARWRRSDTL